MKRHDEHFPEHKKDGEIKNCSYMKIKKVSYCVLSFCTCEIGKGSWLEFGIQEEL
jgi:hypothetical protein